MYLRPPQCRQRVDWCHGLGCLTKITFADSVLMKLDTLFMLGEAHSTLGLIYTNSWLLGLLSRSSCYFLEEQLCDHNTYLPPTPHWVEPLLVNAATVLTFLQAHSRKRVALTRPLCRRSLVCLNPGSFFTHQLFKSRAHEPSEYDWLSCSTSPTPVGGALRCYRQLKKTEKKTGAC